MGLSMIKYFYVNNISHWIGYSEYLVLGKYNGEYYFLFIERNNPIKKDMRGIEMKKTAAKYYLKGLN